MHRSVLIPQDTLGHPRTPQDVQIYIINMLFWQNYVSLYKKNIIDPKYFMN